ncbi:MAG TPA: phospholipase D-like domain-containing protein, partial [Luteolibacter sp.]|nr:phospholipase D-like domain-containing protein [Luteolibacter sp.]
MMPVSRIQCFFRLSGPIPVDPLKRRIKARLNSVQGGLQRRYAEFCRSFPRFANFMGFMRRRRRPLRALFMVSAHALGFVYSIQAVMQTRTEQGAIAWAFALNTIPVVALPAWFVFGSNEVENYRSTMRVGMEEVRPLADKLIRNLDQAAADPEKIEDGNTGAPSDNHGEILKRLEAIGSLPLIEGNSAKLLVDGEATYHAILDAVSAAERYILVQFYIFRDDRIGKRIRDALVAKAREGVDVFVLLDNLGSSGLSDGFIESMEREGMKVRYVMNESGTANRFQLNFRNHRKIVVVDGKRGFLGGLNVGDEYLGKDPKLT